MDSFSSRIDRLRQWGLILHVEYYVNLIDTLLFLIKTVGYQLCQGNF